jgi:hypothetical protein
MTIKAVLVVLASVVCIFVLPLVAVPVVFIVAILWRAGPKWSRLCMFAAALAETAYYFLTLHK